MSNAPAFLYSSVLSGWPNELNAKRYVFPPLNPVILGDAGTPTECDCIGISMPDGDGTVQVFSSPDGSTWTLRATATAAKMRNTLTFFAAVTARYWYIVKNGFNSVAVIKIGKALRMDQLNYVGVAPTAFNQSVNMTPQSMSMGQFLGRQAYGRTGGMSYQFDHTATTWIRDNAMTMIESLRDGAGVFYAWRPEKYPQDVIYGHLSNPISLTNTGTRNYMSGSIAIDGVYDGTYSSYGEPVTLPEPPPPPPAWSPSELSPAAWYDPQDTNSLTLLDTAITSINDLSGNARTLTWSGARPAYSATAFNGLPGIVFSASTQKLITSVFDNPTGADGITLVVAIKRVSAPVNFSVPILKGAVNQQWSIVMASPSQGDILYFRNNLTAGNTAASPSSTLVNGEHLIFSGTISNAAIKQYLQGTELAGSQGAASRDFGASSALTVNLGGANNFDGVFGGIILIHSAVSDADRERLEGWMAHRCGLESSLYIGHPYRDSPP